jgi:hypothetical protein
MRDATEITQQKRKTQNMSINTEHNPWRDIRYSTAQEAFLVDHPTQRSPTVWPTLEAAMKARSILDQSTTAGQLPKPSKTWRQRKAEGQFAFPPHLIPTGITRKQTGQATTPKYADWIEEMNN